RIKELMGDFLNFANRKFIGHREQFEIVIGLIFNPMINTLFENLRIMTGTKKFPFMNNAKGWFVWGKEELKLNFLLFYD
ncbi:hypothetical protein BpHYR1_030420, partial [Brachionus plicatilis]